MAIALESLASLGVLVANGIFIVIAVAGYLRMNSHEQRRQQYLHHALQESREAGLQLKSVARELQHMLDRAERSLAWRRAEAVEPAPQPFNAQPFGQDPDMSRLAAPESAQSMAPQDFAEWQRLQQVEIDRLLQQRRHLLQALEAAQRQATERQTRGTPRDHGRPEQLDKLEKQLDEMRDRLRRSLVEKDFIEERLLVLDAAERESRP